MRIRNRLVVLALLLITSLVGLVSSALAAAPAVADADVPPLTDDLGSWASLVGLGLPAIVALLQRTDWSSAVNALLFAAACVVASVIYGWIKFGGDFSWAHWQGTLLAIVTWGIATYHLYWKPSGIAEKLREVPLTGGPAPARR